MIQHLSCRAAEKQKETKEVSRSYHKQNTPPGFALPGLALPLLEFEERPRSDSLGSQSTSLWVKLGVLPRNMNDVASFLHPLARPPRPVRSSAALNWGTWSLKLVSSVFDGKAAEDCRSPKASPKGASTVGFLGVRLTPAVFFCPKPLEAPNWRRNLTC